MTSIPASRRARATTLMPRSCPSRPTFARTTRIGTGVSVMRCAPVSLGIGESFHAALIIARLAACGLADQDHAHIHDVGLRQPGLEQVARRLEERIGVMALHVLRWS